MLQFNLGNLTMGRNVILSGNNVQGTNVAVGALNTQIVAGGINSGTIFAL